MMKRTSILAVFGFLVASLLAPTSLFAQQQDTTTTLQSQTQDEWTKVSSAVNNIEGELQELEQAADITGNDVELVDVGTMAQEHGTELEQLKTQNQQAIDNLRQTIGTNSAVSEKLSGEGVSTSNVIALDVEQDGSVTVYYQAS